MSGRHFQFERDEPKAAANFLKHGITFETASTVFRNPELLTVADLGDLLRHRHLPPELLNKAENDGDFLVALDGFRRASRRSDDDAVAVR